jgi:hypothetical protein
MGFAGAARLEPVVAALGDCQLDPMTATAKVQPIRR